MIEWTGERFFPEIEDGQIRYEHLHRYFFSSQFTKNKKVLDLACGEGYGSSILARTAKLVIGLDIDKETINNAQKKYSSQENLRFIKDSMIDIKLLEEKFDVVICFEALEHIIEHDKLMKQIKKLLFPSGILLISTPNKTVYSSKLDKTEKLNLFHKKELDYNEFQNLLKNNFAKVSILGQKVFAGSFTWNLDKNPSSNFIFLKREKDVDIIKHQHKLVPLYYLGICSDHPLELNYNLENLIDLDDQIINDVYNKIRGPTYTEQFEKIDSIIHEKDKLLEERHEMILKKNEQLEKLEKELNKTNLSTQEKDKLLDERHKLIMEKNKQLEMITKELERVKNENETLINQYKTDLEENKK